MLRVSMRFHGDITRVRLIGTLDATTAKALSELDEALAAVQEPTEELVLDCAEVTGTDDEGLAALRTFLAGLPPDLEVKTLNATFKL